MRLSALLITASLFLVACNSTPPVVSDIEKTVPTPIIKKNFSTVPGGNFRGQFSLAKNGQGYFKACDADKEFLITANATLRNIYEQITSTPDTPVYLEFAGEISFPQSTNTKSNVIMRVDRVHHMALAKASLQCNKPIDSFLFKANGDNPYWRLSVDNQQLFFSTKASNQAYNVEDTDFISTQINTITTTNEKGQHLTLKIQPGHCYELKNKEYWGYVTKVDSAWGEYSGCGEPGRPIEDQLFTGTYLSSNNNITTHLTLNANYTVKYNEKVEDKEVIKTGFWKSNSQHKIVVMLTQQGKTTLRQELIFNRTNQTLSAAELNKNNIATPFNSALIFNKINAQEEAEAIKVKPIKQAFGAQHVSPLENLDVKIQKALNDYFKIHSTDPENTQFSAVKYDLNGNGIDEAIVLLDWCSQKNGCEMLIFEGNKEGYQFSSRISRIHAPIIISQTQHYLWQSLLVEKEAGWSLLNFDGQSYPLHTRNLSVINKADYSTDVILFKNGKPTQWFPIKIK